MREFPADPRGCTRVGDDPTTWQAALALGVGLMTYGSTASLRPAPRPLYLPPAPPTRCDRCISSIEDGVALSVSRAIDAPIRATVLVEADRAPPFGDRVYLAAAGAGVSALTPTARFGGHIDLLAGAARIDGPVDATSFAIASLTGVDVRVADDLYVGLHASYAQLVGAQPAGTGAISTYGAELRYRWR